jgi:hypothetical protein
MKKLIVFVGCVLLLVSCKDGEKVYIEKEYNWKKHPEFECQNAILLNSYATDERLFVFGQTAFSSLETNLNNEKVSHYKLYKEQPALVKLAITADYFVNLFTFDNGYLELNSTINPYRGKLYFRMQEIDSTFHNFYYAPLVNSMIINENNQLLIPYSTYKNSSTQIKFELIDVRTNYNNGYFAVDTIKTKIIEIPDIHQNSINAIESIGNSFIVTMHTKVYRIDSTGNIVEVLENQNISKIIRTGGKLYGFIQNKVFISQDDGLSWNEAFTFQNIQSNFHYLNYAKVDEKVIGYRDDRLWEINISDTELSAKELDNDGLDGKTITSVSQFDGKVYFTTLSGLYYKALDGFFKHKNEVN